MKTFTEQLGMTAYTYESTTGIVVGCKAIIKATFLNEVEGDPIKLRYFSNNLSIFSNIEPLKDE